MPLRAVILAFTLLLLVGATLPTVGGEQTQQPTGQPMLIRIVEMTPWFDSPGFNLSYTLTGSYPYLAGFTNYSGVANIRVMGLNPNGTLRLGFTSTVSTPLLPNGSVADDPFFPGYLPVLPMYMVLPSSFSVVAPGYALFFVYKGESTVEVDGSSVPVYVYAVSASQGVGGMSPVRKFYYVSRLNGLILYENLSNPYTNSTFTMRLEWYSVPAKPLNYTLQFDAPVYAKPGAQLDYTTMGPPPENISYTTLFSEPSGVFMFRKVNYVGGVAQTPAFFFDNYTQTLFYPAIQSFQQVVKMGVSLTSSALLVYMAKTTVDTQAGSFSVYAYANKTVGFEAYIDTKTGVAVFLEVPPQGAFIELTHSNIVAPLPPAPALILVEGFAAVVVVIAILIILMRTRFRGGQSAYIRSRKR
ncbi:MAG: hypothetical protein QW429_02465 [Thermoprotei archaeon]